VVQIHIYSIHRVVGNMCRLCVYSIYSTSIKHCLSKGGRIPTGRLCVWTMSLCLSIYIDKRHFVCEHYNRSMCNLLIMCVLDIVGKQKNNRIDGCEWDCQPYITLITWLECVKIQVGPRPIIWLYSLIGLIGYLYI